MELRQLVYFEAVARLGGFSRAAAQLHVAQPAISAQIRRLERELGVTLFDRTTRRVALTRAGQVLLTRTRTILGEIDRARTDLDDIADLLHGTFRLGVTPVLGAFDLPGMLADFHRQYPGLTLSVRSGLVAALLDDLDSGAVDAVIAPLHRDLPARFRAQPLTAERVVLVSPPGHLPPTPPTVRIEALRDATFVCLPEGSGLRTILTAAAAAHGFTPRIPFEAADPATIRRFVAAGLGVAFLAESVARGDGPPVDVHRLRPAPAHPPIGLVRRRSTTMTPALRAWIEHLATACSAP